MNQTARHQKLAELAGDMPEIRAIRHRIHSHPEIAFEERSTAALVAEKLAEWGFEVALSLIHI